MNTCKNLRLIREFRGMTQIDFAKKIGVSQQMISYIEKGLKEPSTINLIRMADYLDCSLDELTGRKKFNNGKENEYGSKE